MAEPTLYQPLETIRLLRMHGSVGSILDGELIPFPLNSLTRPKFFVVSYCWGPPVYSHSINLNGISVPVLDSIHPFLKLLPQLNEFPSDSWWWIDSICINQQDLVERSSQVQIMGKIYKAAEKTVVWLGKELDMSFPPDSQDCRDSMASLRLLHQKRLEFTKPDGDVDREKCQELRPKKSGVKWDAVERLLLRPWWRRVWTLQEFIVNDSLVFYCGTESITREEFSPAMYALSCAQGDSGDLISKKAFAGGWNRRRLKQWYNKKSKEVKLISMIAYVGDCGATDDRDRVYAFMGLATDRGMIGTPDYSIGIDELYAKLVKAFIKTHNSLDIICFAHLFNRFTKRVVLKPGPALPSWVPDWRTPVITKVIPLMASQGSRYYIGNFRPLSATDSSASYSAAGDMAPRWEIPKGLRTLICDGIIIDHLDGLGGSRFKDCDWKSKRESEVGLSPVKSTSAANLPRNEPKAAKDSKESRTQGGYSLLQTVSRCLVLDREDRYLNHAITPHQFFNHLVYFCRAALDTPQDVHPMFLNWFQLNKTLHLRGRTLESDCRKAAGKVLSTPPPLDDMSDRKGFLSRFRDTVESMARRLVVTEKGYVGMGPSRAKKGDAVCVLFGCSVPVILRKKPDSSVFEFVGECYLQGFMNGEGISELKKGNLKSRTFHLE